MIKIGGVSMDTSHPLGFAEEMEKMCMDMGYEYECNKGFRGQDEVDWFVKRFGLKGSVNEIEDMVDKVDVGFIQSCNWEKHLDLAMPFIKAGKPVFIDKPIVGSVKDVKRLRGLVKGGAKIMGASAQRYCNEIREFLAKPVEERGEVVSIFVENGVNEFDYAIHSVETCSVLAGAPAVSCKYIGAAHDAKGNPCEAYYIEYENGVTATYYSYHNVWCKCHVTIITTKGPFTYIIDNWKLYGALLREVYKELKTGKSLIPDMETIANCSLAMIAGKKSRDCMNGATVKISDLNDDDKFDGYAFEAAYSAKQKANGKLYKD